MTHGKETGMTMEQFAKAMSQQEDLSPLLQALQNLRSRELDELRDHEIKYLCDWAVWPPFAYVEQPEIRN